MEREFFCQNLGLRKACFIDHLEIPSIIVKKDSEEVIKVLSSLRSVITV